MCRNHLISVCATLKYWSLITTCFHSQSRPIDINNCKSMSRIALVYVLWCRTELYSVSHLHWLLAVEHMSSPLRHHLSKNKNTRAQNRINESRAICWSTQRARNKRLATSFQLYPQICFHFLWLSVSWLSNLPENVVFGLNFIAIYFDKTTNNNILAFSVLSLSHHTEKARSPSVINDVSHTNNAVLTVQAEPCSGALQCMRHAHFISTSLHQQQVLEKHHSQQ